MFKLHLRHKGKVRVLPDSSLENALDNGRMWLASGGDGFHILTDSKVIAEGDSEVTRTSLPRSFTPAPWSPTCPAL